MHDAEDDLLRACMAKEDWGDYSNDCSNKTTRTRAPRTCKNRRPYHINDKGEFVFCAPVQSHWCLLCVKDPHCVTAVQKCIDKFRRRFRMPHAEHCELLAECEESGHFKQWQGKDAVGCASSPLSLPLGEFAPLKRWESGPRAEGCRDVFLAQASQHLMQ